MGGVVKSVGRVSFCDDRRCLSFSGQVVNFWFGDQVRIASDKEYSSKVNARWFGFGPTDHDFINTQMASKDLMAKAAR